MTRNVIVENMGDAVIAIDLEGIVVDFNPTMQTLFDIPTDMIGHPVRTALGEHFKMLERFLDMTAPNETIELPKHGTISYFDPLILPLEKNNQLAGHLVVLRDVTKHYQNQDSHRESAAILRAIVETTADAIISINGEGIIVSFNAAAARIFGYTDQEVIGQNIKILMPEPTASQHDYYIRRRKSTQETKIIGVHREEFGKRKDGTVFPIYLAINEVIVKGRLLYTGLIRDVTEPKRIEKERDQLYTQMQATLAETSTYAERLSLLNEMSNLVNTASTEQEIYQITAQYISRILPTNQLTILLTHPDQNSLRVVVHEGDTLLLEVGQIVPMDGTIAGKAAQTGQASNIGQLKEAHSDFAQKAQELGIQSVLTAPMMVHQQAVGVLVVSSKKVKAYDTRDENLLLHITLFLGIAVENVRRQQQLQQAILDAEKANRAKSEFLATMSHELRTPLNGILGYVQILEKDKAITPKQREGLGIIHRSGDHLLMLINNILDFSKIEAQQMELSTTAFHLGRMLTSLCEMIQIRAEEKGLMFRYEQLSDLPLGVYGDELRLRQVLLNIMGNAVKYTEHGGIMLKVGYHEDRIRFQIEDTGIGIAAEELGIIFKPFKQIERHGTTSEGTGLGLAISTQFVALMGGTLQVSSRLGEGSTFWFELDLPAVDDYVTTPQSVEKITIGYEGATKRIMVVDDKPENRTVLAHMLAPLGFEVLEAADGQDCLDKVPLFKPHAILMDLRMPIMGGLEAMQHLRQMPTSHQLVIIAVSASAFEHNRHESIAAGADDFLPKPFRLQQLLDLLALHLKLQWVIEEDKTQLPEEETQAVTVPPETDLATLLDLAMQGDIRAVINQSEQLAQDGYRSFAATLQSLAQDFKVKELRQFIKKYRDA